MQDQHENLPTNSTELETGVTVNGRSLSRDGLEQRESYLSRLASLQSKADSASFIEASKLSKQADRLQFALDYQCLNPRLIPLASLRDTVRAIVLEDDVATNKARSRIKNRATAIRAYCVWCMGGGGFVDIRNCPSITCPLWPFRLGKDPLRGFEPPAVAIDYSDEDDGDEFDIGEDGDDADAIEE